MNFSRITSLGRWLLLASALLPGVCLADEQTLNSANTGWIMASTALVLFMTLPGLAMFYGGLVRAKNVLSVLMQCFAIAGMVSIAERHGRLKAEAVSPR
ncbi:MAG: hypothetical protein KZQ84_12420 [Candidatus Thiodiazotropha sp. (ex Lucinoma borealis)]|nr:hypothetical protein [Candidatus Thiodiazotropha sp. (ex Lucinoma borealis)]